MDMLKHLKTLVYNEDDKLVCESCDYIDRNGMHELGDICPECNDAEKWWEGLDNEKALEIMEGYIADKGLDNDFREYVDCMYSELLKERYEREDLQKILIGLSRRIDSLTKELKEEAVSTGVLADKMENLIEQFRDELISSQIK